MIVTNIIILLNNRLTHSLCNRKQAVLNEKQFDFLKDIMAAIADVQQDNDESEAAPRPKGRYAIVRGKF